MSCNPKVFSVVLVGTLVLLLTPGAFAQSELFVETAREGVSVWEKPSTQSQRVAQVTRGTVFQVLDLRDTPEGLFYKVRAEVDGQTLDGFIRESDVNQRGTELAPKKPLASEKGGLYAQRTAASSRGPVSASYAVYSLGLFYASSPPVVIRRAAVGLSIGLDVGLTSSHPYGKPLFHFGGALGPEFSFPFGRGAILYFTPALDVGLLFQPTGENQEGEESIGVSTLALGGRGLAGLSFGARSRLRAEAGVRAGWARYTSAGGPEASSDTYLNPVLRLIVTFPLDGIEE
jgi:hypothetical protein